MLETILKALSSHPSFMSVAVTGAGAFLAFNSGTPWEVRVAAGLSAAGAALHEVAQQHATKRAGK